MTLTLYYSPGACSMASHIILRQSGHPFEARRVLISAGENRTPDYLKINPFGRVPALSTPDGILTETVAILTFLAERFPEKRFLPEAPFPRATCLSRMAWFASSVHPTFRIITRTERLSTDPQIQAHLRGEAREPVWSLLQDIEYILQQNRWVGGDAYSVCDPYALVFYAAGCATGFPMEELTACTKHARELCAMDAVREVLEIEASPLLARFQST